MWYRTLQYEKLYQTLCQWLPTCIASQHIGSGRRPRNTFSYGFERSFSFSCPDVALTWMGTSKLNSLFTTNVHFNCATARPCWNNQQSILLFCYSAFGLILHCHYLTALLTQTSNGANHTFLFTRIEKTTACLLQSFRKCRNALVGVSDVVKLLTNARAAFCFKHARPPSKHFQHCYACNVPGELCTQEVWIHASHKLDTRKALLKHGKLTKVAGCGNSETA